MVGQSWWYLLRSKTANTSISELHVGHVSELSTGHHGLGRDFSVFGGLCSLGSSSSMKVKVRTILWELVLNSELIFCFWPPHVDRSKCCQRSSTVVMFVVVSVLVWQFDCRFTFAYLKYGLTVTLLADEQSNMADYNTRKHTERVVLSAESYAVLHSRMIDVFITF